MRRFALITAACTAALLASTAPAATADTPASKNTYVQLARAINAGIEKTDCGDLGTVLRVSKLTNAETTRSGLVANANKAIGEEAALRLVAGPSVNALADRALACGLVKPDPVTPQTQLVQLSSTLSSRANLPELSAILPAFR